MEVNVVITPANAIAALLALTTFLAAAIFPQWATGRARWLPAWEQLASPAALCAPYLLVHA